MKKGIDVSGYQGDINWNKVKNDNIEFAILKYCNIYDDDQIYLLEFISIIIVI